MDNKPVKVKSYERKSSSGVTLKDVKNKIMFDTYSFKDGIFTVRRSFFYRGDMTAEKQKQKVLDAFPNAIIVDYGEHWTPFRGGASVANSSHWYVKFKF